MNPNQANVKSFQALVEFKTDLAKYRVESLQVLATVTRNIRQIQEWLAERQRYWRKQCELAQEALLQARSALERCKASGAHNSETGEHVVPDCSIYEEDVAQAQRVLRQAEEELRNVIHWRKMVEEAVNSYQRQAIRLHTQLIQDVPKAEHFLGTKIAQLETYRAESPSSGGGNFSEISFGMSSTDDFVETHGRVTTPSKILADHVFQDRKGDQFTMHIYQRPNNLFWLRIFETTNSAQIPTTPTSTSAYANFSIESKTPESNKRVRLHDIVTPNQQRGNGIGSKMLEQVERVCKAYHVTEVYGSAPSDETVRLWYQKRGYQFRKHGTEVYKSFSQKQEGSK